MKKQSSKRNKNPLEKELNKIQRRFQRKLKKYAKWLGLILFLAGIIYYVIVGRSSQENDINDNFGSTSTNQTIDSLTELTAGEMQVHFIDVGQGDATLITCDGEAMLIDTGDYTKGTTVQAYLQKQGIKELKYLILTHTDSDHIGGADVVITKFDIDTVFLSDFKKDNSSYRDLMEALSYKDLEWSTPNVGNTYALGSAKFTILAPNAIYDTPNDSSIALIVRNGETSFLFTGDAEKEAEYDILANGLDIDCDVFKAGHHGSSTSNTEDFLEAMSPETVVISCAADNEYGHPHREPMILFSEMGTSVYRTDKQGSIVATTDGEEITWATER